MTSASRRLEWERTQQPRISGRRGLRSSSTLPLLHPRRSRRSRRTQPFLPAECRPSTLGLVASLYASGLPVQSGKPGFYAVAADVKEKPGTAPMAARLSIDNDFFL